MPLRPARDLDRLKARLASMLEVLRRPEDRLYVRVESVSAWSPAQHVDHALKFLEAALDAVDRLVEGADPRIRAAGEPVWQGRVVLLTGWIPRGRAGTPDFARPDPRPVRARLLEAREAAATGVAALRARADDLVGVRGVLEHPLLGGFDARRWLRFADVHTRHHLAIARDVDRHRGIGVPAAETRVGDEPEYGVHAEAP